jgi:hypothetical protein
MTPLINIFALHFAKQAFRPYCEMRGAAGKMPRPRMVNHAPQYSAERSIAE